jgi:GNAT superfamily N-acetyltransferase
MADVVLRTIATRERDAVLDLLAGWLNDRAFFARYFAHDPTFRDDLCFVAEADGRLISTLQVFRKVVRAGGAVLNVACVGNVYTDPEWRAAGLAGTLLERALAAMDAHGFDASLLFASRLDFYARFGWRSLLRQLSFINRGAIAAPAAAAEPFDAARDLGDVMAIYDAYGAAVAGSTVRDTSYWNGHLRYAGNPDERFLVARRDGRVVAYARGTTLYEFPVIIEHGCAAGGTAALADLIAHLHRDATGYSGSLAQLSPDPALAAALAERGLEVRGIDDSSWMWHPLSGERLAAALRVPVGTARADGFFADLLPAAQSRYWMSDRF